MYLNLFSPLEQFQVLPIIPFRIGVIDISITNEAVIIFILFFFSFLLIFTLLNSNSTLNAVPNRWQSILEVIYKMMLSLVVDNVRDKQGEHFFPLVFSVFMLLLSMNLVGLIPYSFTLTSHLIVTFFLSLAVFIGINILCVKRHGIKFFCLFLPPGTSFVLSLLLVPIELISYVFKPVSLSIRLFANMMAGHTLLKVIAGFAFALMANTGILFLVHFVPLLILIPLFALELGVALIQSFVFSLLICIYLNDSINLH
jgi:ATP synthase subunit 6